MPDYARLASQIRSARRTRAERIEKARPEKLADPTQLSLDDVLDLLHTDTARPWMDEIGSRLRSAVAEADSRPKAPYAVGAHPNKLEDPFLDGVREFYSSAFDFRMDPNQLAQAVTTSLAQLTRWDGYIDIDAPDVQQRLGPAGVALLREMIAARADIDRTSLDGSSKNTGKYSGLDPTTAGKVAFSKKRHGYADRMPVVNDLLRQIGDRALAGFSMASVQHLFPSAGGLYDTLFAAGQDPETTFVGGKYYSANVNTVAHMTARGMRVMMDPTDVRDDIVDAEADIKETSRRQLAVMFRGTDPGETGKPRFLLLDDGGKLIQALHAYYPQYAHLCVAVEQTTRGIQVIEEMKAAGQDLLCPVVNMAQCDLKRQFESPLIGESAVWHTERAMADLGISRTVGEGPDERPRTAVVVGFGATGAATAESLRRHGFHVVVTDRDPAKLEEAKARGFDATTRDEALEQAEILVGSTGRGALDASDWEKLPSGAVLVNGASGNHELGVGDLTYRDLDGRDPDRVVLDDGAITSTFEGRTVELGHANDDIRLAHRVIRTPNDKELLFVRGGSVVNMEHDLPPEYRQIIVAMLVASCAQAVKSDKNELVDFDPKMQDFLLARFRRALAKEQLPIDVPDFDAITKPFG